MTRRNCPTPAKVGSSDADTDHTLIAVTSFCSLDSLSKENARDSNTGVTVNKDGVRSSGDVKRLVDVTGGGSENVRRLRDVDGGWAWVVLVTSCVSLAVQEVTYSAVGMFQVEFQMTFGGSRGFLALIGSIFVTCTGMLGPLAGALSTQLTPRVTVMMGGAFISLGLVSGSFVSSPTSLLLTYGILGGLGNALIYTPAATAFSGYFVRLRQVANGFVMGSAGVGSLLGPYLARWFIDTHGWRYSLAASGFLTAQVCVLGALIFPRSGSPGLQFFRQTCTRHRPKKKKGKGSEDGETGEKEEMTTAFLGGKSGAEETVFGEEKLTNGSRASFRSRVWKVVVRKEVWILCVNEMLLMTGYNIELLHQPSYIHSMGVDRRHFPNLFLAFGSSMMFIRVVGGFVFTRFDSHLFPTMFVSEMLMALALALLPLYGVTLPALFVFNVLTGLSYGVGFLLAIPALIKYIGVELLPLAYGLMLLCCGSGSVLAVSSAGLLYDFLGTYKASFYLAGCLTGAGALVLLLLFCVRRQQTEEMTSDNVEANFVGRKQERK